METQLNNLGLNVVRTLKHNVLVVKKTPVSDKSQTFCLKLNTSEQEIKLFKDCFPKISQENFKLLRLPVAYKIGSFFENQGWWVLMDYFDGESIKWDETNPECIGGLNIGLEYVDILVDVLVDLKSIDTKLFSGVLPSVETAGWYTNLNQKLTDLVSQGLFPTSFYQKAVTMLSTGLSDESKKNFIVTNGDFQFRNFIKLSDNKIAVIDWTENSYNTPNLEPLEFPIMYQWTLMWANPAWQNAYYKKATSTFNISKERLSYSLLVKSINQAHLWRGSQDLARRQLEHGVRAIEGTIV